MTLKELLDDLAELLLIAPDMETAQVIVHDDLGHEGPAEIVHWKNDAESGIREVRIECDFR